MKKLILMVLVVLLMIGTAQADDLGVQIIGGDDVSLGPVSLDDLKINAVAEIPGYGEVTVTDFHFTDSFLSIVKGLDITQYKNSIWYVNNEGGWCSETQSYHHIEFDGKYWSEKQVVLNESKTQADFAMLTVDILNISGNSIDFLEKASVKVIYNDSTEFAGWFRQFDADISDSYPLNSADIFAIDPYYIGHYLFGCTLPNTVVSSKEPLRMEISLGENELTYHIRK